jgi:hypothetical protein
MTRREWARGCLQDLGCPDDMLDLCLQEVGIRSDDWTTDGDDGSGGHARHDERAAIRQQTEEALAEMFRRATSPDRGLTCWRDGYRGAYAMRS